MLGLKLRAVGENPAAADAAGLNVSLYRIGAIVAGSAAVGLAGGYISVVSGQAVGHGHGRRARLDRGGSRVFARWAPWPALAGALLFGCIEGVVPRIAAAGIPRTAISHADDALCRDNCRDDVGGSAQSRLSGRAGGARSAACAGRTEIME